MTSVASHALHHALTDRYDLARQIGRGGMATVYLATDRKHDRQVAIKIMHPELATPFGADRFQREVRLVARLQHPHILPLYDSGEAGGQLFFVMPYVEGESLRDLLRRDGALTLERAVRIVRQIADALDYAHARGVVHRDLKPDNILLVEGQALLADFGVARALESSAGEGVGDPLTSIAVRLGTPAYMSPEQAAGDPNADHRSDIYGLGCVCYELLAGEPPFTGANAMAIVSQHIVAPVPMLIARRGAVPEAVHDAFDRALAKDPADRFQHAGEFAASLERAIADSTTPTAADTRLQDIERQQAAGAAVLVLDFANVAGAADADWLSTGIAETVGTDLHKVPGIRVVGQDAASRRRIDGLRRGRPVDASLATELGRSTGATWVVWGTFQKLGSRIRIMPRFVDARDGRTVTATKIDGSMDEIFQLQDRIVIELAEVLRVRLTAADVARIERPETTDLGAYEHYALGYRTYLQFGKESTRLAAEHYRQAIAIDPKYAIAHAGLGVLHGPMYIATGRRDVLEDGERLLQRALALDPTLGEAHAWLAYMQFRLGRFDECDQTATRGVECDPSSSVCWYMLGVGRVCRGAIAHEPAAFARAVPPLLRAVVVNPGNHLAHMALGAVYALRGAHAHAVSPIERAMAVETEGTGLQFVGSLVQRALLHLGLGETEAAGPLANRAIARYSGADHVYAEAMTAYAFFARGCLFERTGGLDEALHDFTRACDVAERHEHRISIGAHWVKSRLGLARVLHRLGRTSESERALTQARELFTTRARFVWAWFYGAADAEVLYELAATLATIGQREPALTTLRQAADAGWADVTYMRHDPAFVHLRDTPEMLRLCGDAVARVELPPPIGSGGLG